LIIDDGSTDTEIRVRAVVTDVPGDPVTYAWTVNNAVPADVVNDTNSLVLDRSQFTGFITIEVFVTDDDNETSALQALYVGGTNTSDTITVAPTANPEDPDEAVTVSVSSGNQSVSGDFVPTGVIVISGVGSDDTIVVDSAVLTPTSISGGPGNDSITSGSGGDYIDGGIGNDVMIGGDGDDTMVSADGDDTMEGGAGNDSSLIRGFSTKTLVDGSGPDGGIDTIDFSLVEASATGDEGVTLDLSLDAGEVQTVRDAGEEVSLQGTFENVNGTSFRDSFTGNDSDNLLFGGSGDDTRQQWPRHTGWWRRK
jgi:Ca2+-binding RTX toxin-like protein